MRGQEYCRTAFIAAIACLLLLPACKSPIDLDLGSDEDRLVLLANLGVYPSNRIYVGQSKDAENLDRMKYLSGATVRVLENGILRGTVEEKLVLEGNQLIPVYEWRNDTFQTLARYTVEVRFPTYPDVSASSILPEEPKNTGFTLIGVNETMIDPETREYNFITQVKFPDALGRDDFYHALTYLRTRDTGSGDTSLYYLSWQSQSQEDPRLFVLPQEDGALVNDFKSDGQIIQLNARGSIRLPVSEQPLQLLLDFRHVSEEYYRFHYSLGKQLIVQQDPFAEPVILFSNVKDGLGNASTYVQKIVAIDIQ